MLTSHAAITTMPSLSPDSINSGIMVSPHSPFPCPDSVLGTKQGKRDTPGKLDVAPGIASLQHTDTILLSLLPPIYQFIQSNQYQAKYCHDNDVDKGTRQQAQDSDSR